VQWNRRVRDGDRSTAFQLSVQGRLPPPAHVAAHTEGSRALSRPRDGFPPYRYRIYSHRPLLFRLSHFLIIVIIVIIIIIIITGRIARRAALPILFLLMGRDFFSFSPLRAIICCTDQGGI